MPTPPAGPGARRPRAALVPEPPCRAHVRRQRRGLRATARAVAVPAPRDAAVARAAEAFARAERPLVVIGSQAVVDAGSAQAVAAAVGASACRSTCRAWRAACSAATRRCRCATRAATRCARPTACCSPACRATFASTTASTCAARRRSSPPTAAGAMRG